MGINATHAYEIDGYVAEIYDGIETQTDDLKLIRSLIAARKGLRILEPFCGTGRLLIPLAQDGHDLVGLDRAKPMLERARGKLAQLPDEVRDRVTLVEADATVDAWPSGFDLVLLGGNCLYELATSEEQERFVTSAAAALKPGGYIYVDNDHMEGELESAWREPGQRTARFPTGVCGDGTRVEGTTETIWYDAPRRLVRFRRTVTITRPDGATASREWLEQKHPPSTDEVQAWVARHGFVVEAFYGDREGNPYVETSPRAIFWARKSGAIRP